MHKITIKHCAQGQELLVHNIRKIVMFILRFELLFIIWDVSITLADFECFNDMLKDLMIAE